MTVGVVSLGCAKNQVDTEQMLSLLSEAGYTPVPDASQADVILVNTCGFIQSAKEESIDTILSMAHYKIAGRCKALVVTGCLAQRYSDALLSDIPEIDAIVGVSQVGNIVSLVEDALSGERPCDITRQQALAECGRVLTTPPYTAYVRIGEGCDNRCAYCAIPLIRGGHRSRPKQYILDEMKTLASSGVREHILIAQDTTRYGRDLAGESLQTLMRDCAQVEGVDWLRVLYCYPDETTTALIDEMAAHGNICKYLDLPLQHASPRLLARMNRRGDIDEIANLLQYARSKGFALRTTFIVGFPGETDDDFDRLMRFTRDMAFDRMGAFAYSQEEDTPAYAFDNQVPEEVKAERLDALMRLQADISLARGQTRVGATERVLVTGQKGALYTGRSAWEAPDADGEILFSSKRRLRPGQFACVRLTRADTYDLYGEEEL